MQPEQPRSEINNQHSAAAGPDPNQSQVPSDLPQSPEINRPTIITSSVPAEPVPADNVNTQSQAPAAAPNPPAAPAAGVSAAVPVSTAASAAASSVSPAPAGSGSQKSSKKKLLLMLAIPAVLLLGIGGVVFGYYIPNQPENVWKTAMDRTAGQVEALADKIADPQVVDTISKTKLQLKGSVEADDIKASLDVQSRYDKDASDNSLNFDASGDEIGQGINLGMQFKSQRAEDSSWPNLYFSVSGFKGLGLESFIPGIDEFDNKWIAVEQDAYQWIQDSLGESRDGGTEEDDADSERRITHEDIASIVQDISEVSREYLFSNDETKAVLQMKQFVATEESEGIQANRYKAAINQDNAVKYCEVLVSRLLDNAAVRRIGELDEGKVDEMKREAKEDCAIPEDQRDANEEFDVWIDKKYKIVHKIRVYEDLEKANKTYRERKAECQERYAGYDFDDDDSFCDHYDGMIESGERYVEFGQIYDGNDKIRLFQGMHSDTNSRKQTMRTDVDVDINTLIFNGQIMFEDKGESGVVARAELSTEPYDGQIDTSRPEGSTSIIDVYEYLSEKQSQLQRDQYYPMGTDFDELEGGNSLGVQTPGQSSGLFWPLW